MCEFQDGSERLDTYLQALAQKLNSNEEFSPDDTFTMETSFIRTPGPGGKKLKKYTPGYEAIRKHIAHKTSIVTINNDDQLCCASAIVTTKAYLDEGHEGLNEKNLRKGCPIQEKMAKELHQKANVPDGPYGLKELQQSQDTLPGYQMNIKEVKASCLPGQLPKPHKVCASCNRLFFGQSCYDSHKIGTKQNKPLCDVKKCLQCRSVYEAASLENNPKGAGPKNKYKHNCG